MRRGSPASDPEELRTTLKRFLDGCRSAELHEPGESPFSLDPSSYALEVHGGRLTIQAWDDRRNFVRRVLDAHAISAGRMDLVVERFGKRTGTALLIDADRPQHRDVGRRSLRWVFREEFRRFLAHAFPGWRVAEISAEPDLEHSLSPVFPRAFVKKGAKAWAAIACDRQSQEPAHALTFGLIWLEHLRRREQRVTVEGLALCLPEGAGLTTCLRLRHLNTLVAQFAVFLYSPDGFVSRLDERDWGNLDTRLASSSTSGNQAAETPNSPGPPRLRHPEQRLESQVRANIAEIDAELLDSPLYGQVPSFAGGERGIADLLAVSRAGRLAVIELKVSQDLHLPLQSLDYWMRVNWHHVRRDFDRSGYFPGIALANQPPRLLMVAPALEFHPTTETILQYFSPSIEVERFGLGVEWQRRLKVVFRARGAARPG